MVTRIVVVVVGVGAGTSTVNEPVAATLPVHLGLGLAVYEDVRDLLMHHSGKCGHVLPDGRVGAGVVDA